MKILSFTGGPVAVNTYIASNDCRSAVIIDPSDAGRIADIMSENSFTPCAILLTHGHFDHIWALKEIIAHYSGKASLPVYVGEKDLPMLTSPVLNLSEHFGINDKSARGKSGRFLSEDQKVIIITVKDGDDICTGNVTFKVISTPGHSMGSVCYLTGNCLFSGDTLFRLSAGRCDLPGSDEKQLLKSLVRLQELPSDTGVYPGHGEFTTIGFEQACNPYFGI